MKKIRILHTVEDLKVGGLENILKNIVFCLDKNLFDVHVWCLASGGKIADEIKSNNIDVEILDIDNYHNPFKVLKLYRKIKNGNFDIIHTHGYFANTAGRITAKMASVPVIISHIHSIYSINEKKHIFTDKILSLLTDRIICISDTVKRFVVRHEGINESKVTTIYNGISGQKEGTHNADAIKKEFGISDNAIVLGTIASLNRHKGHKYIIDAALDISNERPDITLLIIGEGPLKTELKEYVKKNSASSKIIFTGERSDIYNLLSVIDIFILYSTEEEGLGISMIEAMSVGKPVIASRIGGIPEVVKDGVTGCLVKPMDHLELSRTIIDVIKNKDKMKRFGEEGKKRFIEMFRVEKMVKHIERVYKEELKKKVCYE